MDKGTTRDFIQDLQEENARLHQAIANLCAEMVLLESDADNYKRGLLHMFTCGDLLCRDCSNYWLSAKTEDREPF
jgi:hypothetical protein